MSTAIANPKGWWDLHLRNARGEELSPEERRLYEEHLARLEGSEILSDDLEDWRLQREEITRLEAECHALQAKREDLAKEIARLDAILDGRSVGVGS
jgi:hypothetical protein